MLLNCFEAFLTPGCRAGFPGPVIWGGGFPHADPQKAPGSGRNGAHDSGGHNDDWGRGNCTGAGQAHQLPPECAAGFLLSHARGLDDSGAPLQPEELTQFCNKKRAVREHEGECLGWVLLCTRSLLFDCLGRGDCVYWSQASFCFSRSVREGLASQMLFLLEQADAKGKAFPPQKLSKSLTRKWACICRWARCSSQTANPGAMTTWDQP